MKNQNSVPRIIYSNNDGPKKSNETRPLKLPCIDIQFSSVESKESGTGSVNLSRQHNDSKRDKKRPNSTSNEYEVPQSITSNNEFNDSNTGI